jgi:hypothetical protein
LELSFFSKKKEISIKERKQFSLNKRKKAGIERHSPKCILYLGKGEGREFNKLFLSCKKVKV